MLRRFAPRNVDEDLLVHLVLDARYERVWLEGVVQTSPLLVPELSNRDSVLPAPWPARGRVRRLGPRRRGPRRALAELLPEAVCRRSFLKEQKKDLLRAAA